MKFRRNRRKSQFRYLEKGALELYRAATTKPRQIERSGFFLLDHNGQTRVYRLVLSPSDVRLWRKRDSPIEEEDCPPPPRRYLGLNDYFFSSNQTPVVVDVLDFS